MPISFFPRCFAARGEFGDGRRRRRFRRLTAGVGVDFRIEHEHIHVIARREHVIQTAEADVIGPAVAAENPLRTFEEKVAIRAQFLHIGVGVVPRVQERDDAVGPFARAFTFHVMSAPVFERFAQFRIVDRRTEIIHDRAQTFTDGVVAGEHAETEFRVVLKERVRPRRTVAVLVRRVRHRRRAGAVNAGTAGGVRDQHAIPEELRDEFNVRCFAATRAGTGKFKIRRLELTAFDRFLFHRIRFLRQAHRVIPQGLFVDFFFDRFHDERFALGGADVDAVAATVAVFLRDDDAELHAVGADRVAHDEAFRSRFRLFFGG